MYIFSYFLCGYCERCIIVKLKHCNLDLYQCNFNNIYKLCSSTSPPSLLSVVDVPKLHFYTLCVQKPNEKIR